MCGDSYPHPPAEPIPISHSAPPSRKVPHCLSHPPLPGVPAPGVKRRAPGSPPLAALSVVPPEVPAGTGGAHTLTTRRLCSCRRLCLSRWKRALSSCRDCSRRRARARHAGSGWLPVTTRFVGGSPRWLPPTSSEGRTFRKTGAAGAQGLWAVLGPLQGLLCADPVTNWHSAQHRW